MDLTVQQDTRNTAPQGIANVYGGYNSPQISYHMDVSSPNPLPKKAKPAPIKKVKNDNYGYLPLSFFKAYLIR